MRGRGGAVAFNGHPKVDEVFHAAPLHKFHKVEEHGRVEEDVPK